MSATPRRLAVTTGLMLVAVLVCLAVLFAVPVSGSTGRATTTTLSKGDAVILGVVEGLTEYLPISSTGHLLVTSRILDLPDNGKPGDAIKSYEIAIQFGAILAVLMLYRRRIGVMLEGVVGRSTAGKHLGMAVLTAFVPAAFVGLVSEKIIKDVLFGVWPVVAAWLAGGVAVLVLSRRGRLAARGGRPLTDITRHDAVVIGLAQVLALWPGVSRSLVTILAALLIGLSMSAAVEFTFLLGFVTLGAATAYETVKDGHLMVDSFGVAVPLIGLGVALVAAVASIKWMVRYLTTHDLGGFGWYRIGIAVVTFLLVSASAI